MYEPLAMDVSVIVTSKNEEAHMGNCLRSIKEQTYPQQKLEIIVVDNNSTDKTKGIAKRYTDKVYNFGPERSAQRNTGAKQAEGRYILYLDADMSLSSNVIKECMEKCQSEDDIALYIPERIIGNGFWIKVRDFERRCYNATCIDCVRFVRRNEFLEIGGFDESLTGPEDWDFDRRIKEMGKVGIIDSPIYHNEEEFDFRKYVNKKAYYAKSFDKYIQKWGDGDSIIKKQLGLWYRYFGVFTEEGKWKRLLGSPLMTLALYYLRFMVGIQYLLRRQK